MKKFFQITVAFALTMVIFGSTVQAQTWKSDPVHSSMVFQVRHILTPFVGKFDKFNVDIVWDEKNLDNASVNATLEATSVNTGNDGRNKHLNSPEFFDTAKNPTWTFKSTSVQKNDEGYVAHGILTAGGKENKVSLPFQFLGSMDMEKGKKAGFSAEFTIKRSEYGLGGDMGGGIGDDVKVMAFLEMIGE